MLVASHKNGTIPGTKKEADCKYYNTPLILNMHMPEKFLLHNLYKCSLIIIIIISINDVWL